MSQRTLSIIKPDATKRNLTETINKIIENNGLKIIAQKKIKLEISQAKEFYKIHNEKPFFEDLIEFMCSETVVIQVLEGDNAVKKYREVMGSTDPKEAAIGTIRKVVGISKQENSVHGSDSDENSIKEIDFFFSKDEIPG